VSSTPFVRPISEIEFDVDIAVVLATGTKCLVLTERIEHCETLLELVRQKSKGIHAAISNGSN